MSIKQNNVMLLQGKVNELLSSLPADVKSGEKFRQAEKAMAKLHEINYGINEKANLIFCAGRKPIFNGNLTK